MGAVAILQIDNLTARPKGYGWPCDALAEFPGELYRLSTV